jgi:hypothetical protein
LKESQFYSSSLKTSETVFKFTPHSVKQSKLIHSRAAMTIAATGTQWGKSIAGALWMLKQMYEFDEAGSMFLIMSPTYKIMQQSVIPHFTSFARHLGSFNQTEAVFETDDKQRVFFRTETDPDSIVGIPKVRAYWLDEAGKVSLYFHENIQARAASVGARGLYSTSPYTRNWLFKDYIAKKRMGELPDVELICAASWENPYHSLHDITKRNQMRMRMDPRRFDMLFGGEWGTQAGLVYDCFDHESNICEPFRLPAGTSYYGGIDWGHTEPFVIVIRAVTPEGKHYQVSEFYKTGMTVPDQLAIARQKMDIFGVKMFYCGHERPENIMLFNQKGVPAIPVPEKDIQLGTDLHYELIKTLRYKIFNKTSPHTIDEIETYHYPEPEDLDADDDAEDQAPVGQNDHCMSANRFVTLRTYKAHVKLKAYTPVDEGDGERKETQEMRLKRLMKPKNQTRIF